MPELFLSIPLALVILLACHEAGRLTLWLTRSENPLGNPLDNALLKFAFGYIVIGFILSLFGHFHIYKPGPMWVLLILFALTSFVCSVRRKSLGETWDGIKSFSLDSRKTLINSLFFAVLILALAMDFILTCTPTTAWDSLTYHYPMPAIYLRAGYFIPRLDICYSELPFGSEMLFGWAFGLGGLRPDNTGIGHLAANHLTWFTGLFAIVSLVSITRRFAEKLPDNANGIWDRWTPGLVAGLALMSLPIMFIEEMEGGYIENFLVFFTLVMFTALLHYRETRDPKLILAIGILAGGLLASKHTSLFVDIIALLALMVWIPGSRVAKHWLYLLGAMGLAILIPMPWYLKSFMHTGDFAYPFVTQILHPDAKVPDIMYWSNPNVERSFQGFAKYIERISLDESLTQFKFRLLSWYFLPMLPFTYYILFIKGRIPFIWFTAWILIAIIYLLAPGEPRYMLVAWGFYAALGAWGLLVLFTRIPWSVKYILPLLLILPIGFSFIERSQEVNKRVPTIIGIASVDEYFEKSLDIWPLIKYINTETEPDDGVILVEPRIFYVQRPYKVWYPYETQVSEEIDLPTKNRLESWKTLGFKYLMLTYGPNYRALALYGPDMVKERGLFSIIDLPDWVPLRAKYVEKVMSGIVNNDLVVRPDLGYADRRLQYDVLSIAVIDSLFRTETLEKLDVNSQSDNVGLLFKINYDRRFWEDSW